MDLYHVLNRGVDKRKIFLESDDYIRFVHSLYEFNDHRPANNTEWRLEHVNNDLRGRYSRAQLVDIHGWCLMKNHYHLLLSERVEGGITKFLMKFNVGYAKFFNEKYKRVGTLFQGRTKKVLVERDSQYNYILHYIHLNPLDYLSGAKNWRVRDKSGIQNAQNAIEYLDAYRWSSYLDYTGKKNFPSLITTSLFGTKEYKEAITEYLRDAEESAVPRALE